MKWDVAFPENIHSSPTTAQFSKKINSGCVWYLKMNFGGHIKEFGAFFNSILWGKMKSSSKYYVNIYRSFWEKPSFILQLDILSFRKIIVTTGGKAGGAGGGEQNLNKTIIFTIVKLSITMTVSSNLQISQVNTIPFNPFHWITTLQLCLCSHPWFWFDPRGVHGIRVKRN